jgi:hypothetical protein
MRNARITTQQLTGSIGPKTVFGVRSVRTISRARLRFHAGQPQSPNAIWFVITQSVSVAQKKASVFKKTVTTQDLGEYAIWPSSVSQTVIPTLQAI